MKPIVLGGLRTWLGRGALALLAASPLVGCTATDGDDGATDGGDAGDGGSSSDGGAVADAGDGDGDFALTSPTLVDGGAMPEAHTCNGDNTSPALTWTGAPEGTAGFGLVFTDTSIDLIHTVMWDIPGDATSLPADVDNVFEPPAPAGARQTLGYDNSTRGWLGPCPPNEHTYVLTLYAVSDRPLSGLDESSTRAEVESALQGASLGTATLTVTYGP